MVSPISSVWISEDPTVKKNELQKTRLVKQDGCENHFPFQSSLKETPERSDDTIIADIITGIEYTITGWNKWYS